MQHKSVDLICMGNFCLIKGPKRYTIWSSGRLSLSTRVPQRFSTSLSILSEAQEVNTCLKYPRAEITPAHASRNALIHGPTPLFMSGSWDLINEVSCSENGIEGPWTTGPILGSEYCVVFVISGCVCVCVCRAVSVASDIMMPPS